MMALEEATSYLISREWDEEYAVLVKIASVVKDNPKEMYDTMVSNPAFVRAIFQSQLSAGIASLDNNENSGINLSQLQNLTEEDLKKLTPEQRNKILLYLSSEKQ